MSDQQPRFENVHFRFWQACLTHLLGWTADEVVLWADAVNGDWGTNENSIVYHRQVYQAVAPLLIPSRVLFGHGQYINVVQEMEEALVPIELLRADAQYRNDFDWESAKKRVEKCLQRFGATLDESIADRRVFISRIVKDVPQGDRK